MALITVAPPPGIYRSGTVYQAKGRWWDANLMRPRENELRPVKGWQLRSSAAPMSGAPRSILTWRDNSNNRWIGIGTSSKLYVQNEAGTNADITPLRKTTNPLAGNPIAAVVGVAVVTITDTAHGAVVGSFVTISGATTFAGLATGSLNQTFQILSVPTADSYTVNAGASATSTASGGGAAVVAKYQIAPGRADATQNLGYGGGTYGSGFYGVPGSSLVSYLPATVWDQDAWGETEVVCSDNDGKIYQWSLSTTTPAAIVTNAPTGCIGLVVTEDGFLFALQASGDRRRVAWCDQQNLTVWTPSATNQAGDYDLPTSGTIQCARAVPGGALILTDVDAWLAQYISTPLVYGFQRVGSGCGPISRGAMVARDSLSVWMGRGAFWIFNGQSVQALDCEARERVFDNLNANQRSKVTVVHLADQGEVQWFYPSTSANEVDSYVTWCYRESQRLGRNVWMVGSLARSAGTSSGIFDNPILASPTGLVYEHETGLNYDGARPYIETGIIELGKGDTLMEIQRIIPDDEADGDVTATVYGRMWPGSAETTLATLSLISPTDLLVQAREVRVRFTVTTDSAIGAMRFDVIRGDPI